MRIRGWLAAPGVLIAGVMATACATLPTSGIVQLNTSQGSSDQPQHGVQIVPVPPGPGWSQTEIVSGFLAASASFDNNHAVARQYLTRKFSRIWKPGWAATIINSPNPSLAKTPKGVAPQTPTALVYLTGHVAELQTAGPDQAGSVVVSPAPSKYQFSLVQVPGGWRIDGILRDNMPVKPTFLLLSSTDFARDYQPRDLYFYSMRSARDALVPDPVYIPQTAPESEVQGLVNALIRPSLSWLSGAATTAFPRKTTLITPPQVIGGITAIVDVGGAASRASAAQQQRMAAQLYWSLTCAPYATQCASPIKSVVLYINHHRSSQLSPGNVSTLVPRGTPGPLYYQPAGGQQLAIDARPAAGARALTVPLPVVIGSTPFTSMAVSTGQQGPPTLAGCTGKDLYLIKLTAAIQEAKKLSAGVILTAVRKPLPAGCSSLSWDNSGNLWITAGSKALVLPTAGSTALAKVSLVSVQLPQLSAANPPPITGLKVAPDGVRVAMILGAGPGGKRIQVGAISRSNLFTYIGQKLQTLRVGSDIANPVALSWLDPDHLLVLSRSSSGRTQLFEAPLNGGQSAQISTPGEVISVAASWPNGHAEPQVIIGLAPGQIDMSKGAWPNPDWVPVAAGTLPVYPG
jgi:Lipoprotein LpqB beta-propeller domain/Sporulation and spore germination